MFLSHLPDHVAAAAAPEAPPAPGELETVIGRWHGRYVHIPMPLAVSHRNQVAVDGDLWLSVLEATGQPRHFT